VGEMVTARLLTNCSNTLRNIHTNARERISQGHVQNGRRDTFSWPTMSHSLTPRRYNPCRVFAESRGHLQPSLSLVLLFQFLTPSLNASLITASIHLRKDTCKTEDGILFRGQPCLTHSLPGTTTHAGSWPTQEVASNHLYLWSCSSNF